MPPGLLDFHPEERMSMWMGRRPSLPDLPPVLGPSRATQDVLYTFGHGHVGTTAAPMIGKVVAVSSAAVAPRSTSPHSLPADLAE
jgi:D-amino-acid dehydrogenase